MMCIAKSCAIHSFLFVVLVLKSFQCPEMLATKVWLYAMRICISLCLIRPCSMQPRQPIRWAGACRWSPVPKASLFSIAFWMCCILPFASAGRPLPISWLAIDKRTFGYLLDLGSLPPLPPAVPLAPHSSPLNPSPPMFMQFEKVNALALALLAVCSRLALLTRHRIRKKAARRHTDHMAGRITISTRQLPRKWLLLLFNFLATASAGGQIAFLQRSDATFCRGMCDARLEDCKTRWCALSRDMLNACPDAMC